MMLGLLFVFIFLFGLAVGSFLNAFLHRLHTGESIFKKEGAWVRSYCPHCRHELSWQDLIPLLSFVLLKGKCRYCRKKISLQYPLVELAAGFLFIALLYLQFQFSDGRFWLLGWQAVAFWVWHLLYWLFLASALIAIFVYDLKHFLIPDIILYPAIAIAFLNRLLETVSPHYWTQFGVNDFAFKFLELTKVLNFGFWTLDLNKLIIPILVGLIAYAFFALIVLVSRGKWMGLGDAKLAFLIGLVLGFPLVAVALFVAFFAGAIVGIGLVLAKKKTMKSEVPFGPFLVTGTFVALFWGKMIIDWYWSVFV